MFSQGSPFSICKIYNALQRIVQVDATVWSNNPSACLPRAPVYPGSVPIPKEAATAASQQTLLGSFREPDSFSFQYMQRAVCRYL